MLAVGNEWYNDVAPTVTYGGVEIASDGTETYEGKEYFAYSITVDKNADVSISGIIDNIPVSIVDIYGETHITSWNINMQTVGNLDGFDRDDFYPLYTLFEYQDKNLKVDYDYNSDWDSIVLLTTNADIESRILGETEYASALSEYIKTAVYPQKGEENVYYLVYFETTETKTFYTGYTLPYDATDVQYRTSTDSAWRTWDYTEEGPDNTAPHYSVWNQRFNAGTVLYVRFTMPDGSFPTLYDVETNAEYNAAVYTIDEEEVTCYRVEITDRDVHLSANFENTHTVSFVNAISDYYTIYNVAGNSPNYDGITVQDNGIYRFRISYQKQLSDILNLIVKNDDDTWSFVEGYEPLNITGSVTASYNLDVSVYSWSGEIGSCTLWVDFKDITSDVSIEINCEKRASADIAFTISEDYEIYVDDVLIEGEAGQVVTASVSYDSKIKLIVKKDGYQFEGRLLNGKWMKQINVIYHYIDNGTSKQSNSYAGSMNATSTEFVFEFGSYSFKSQYDLTQPCEFQFANVVPTRVDAIQNTAKSDATDANGVSFVSGAPISASKDGNLTFDIVVPYGKVPVLYVQYSDTLSDGYLPYEYISVVKNGSTNTYTFDVPNIRCDVVWYIKLNAEMFDVTFRFGDTTLVLNLPYGTSLSDVSELPQSFSGEQDGIPGLFEIIGWSTTEGGEEDILMVDGEKTLWAVTNFTAAVAVFNGTYYTDLNAAFDALKDDSTGNLDLVFSTANTPTLKAGNYTLPAGVTLRLPYALNAYGRTLAEEADRPSLFYADNSRGTVALILGEGVILNVYGKISVGGIVGYKLSAKPYQGQTSADYAVLQLDGVINVQSGGIIEVNGYIVGNGSLHLLNGAVSKLPFIVKDYKGGTNSSNVYSEGYVPFNVYEMPNIQTNYYIYYGAKEYAYAMLVALGGYNETEICAIGSDGMIRLSQGGYILKKTTQITNPRYSESTKSYEPQYEFRTTLDIYGGGRDGALTLDLGFVQLGMEDMVMAIPYTYSNITLHNGQYDMYNMFKIMPGAKLTVANDATLTIKNQTVDGKTYLAGLIVYNDTFVEDHGTCKTFANSKQLLYPSQPNGIQEGGSFVVNGTLVLEGKFGGDIISEEAGAQIKVKSLPTHLSFSAAEAIQPSGVDNIIVTYQQTSTATVNGKTVELEQNKIYRSYVNDSGEIEWR